MFTGPTTHQSPVINCPVFAGLSKVQVIPYWLFFFRLLILARCASAVLSQEENKIKNKMKIAFMRLTIRVWKLRKLILLKPLLVAFFPFEFCKFIVDESLTVDR